MKRWSLGTYHGLRRKHATHISTNSYFATIAASTGMFHSKHCWNSQPTTAASYWDIIKRDNPRKGAEPPTPLHIDEPESTG